MPLTPEQQVARDERNKWYRWSDYYEAALKSLIEHHPDMPDIVERAMKIADEAMSKIESRRPKDAID